MTSKIDGLLEKATSLKLFQYVLGLASLALVFSHKKALLSQHPHINRRVVSAVVGVAISLRKDLDYWLFLALVLPLYFVSNWESHSVISLFWLSEAVRSPFNAKSTAISLVLFVLEFPSKDVQILISKATLAQWSPAFKNCYKNGSIKFEDLIDDFDFSSEADSQRLERNFRGNLISAILRSFYPTLIATYSLQTLRYLLEFLKPYILRKIIQAIDLGLDLRYGTLLSAALYLNFLLISQVSVQETKKNLQLSSEISVALESLVFKKAQKLSRKSREEFPTGKITTLITSDVGRITHIMKRSGEFFTAPTQLLVCMLSLWNIVGNSMIGALLIIGIFIPLNTYILNIIRRYVQVQRKLIDNVNQAVSSLFSSMKLLKLYTWEVVLMEKLFKVKKDENIPATRTKMTWNRVANFFWLIQPFLVSLTTLSWYTFYYKKPLTADIVFPAVSLLKVLLTPIVKIPQLLTQYQNAQVSLKKVMSFLETPELLQERRTDDSGFAIQVEGSFFWNVNKPALNDVNFTVKKGEFVALVGRVGAGKTAFLSAILGELEGKSPLVNGTIAYVSQSPWILNGSLRDNVLFGRSLNETTYEAVLSACQLDSDIERFPDHDLTLVGEKGISLSGGQKARVSLARALYSAADIYILDDVLAAVDNHVGQKLILEIFSRDGVLRDKTVVMATNNLPVLTQSTRICLLEEGKVVEEASFDEIQSTTQWPRLKEHLNGQQNLAIFGTIKVPIVKQLSEFRYDPFSQHFRAYKGMLHEETSKGKVLWEVYGSYLKACSVKVVVLIGLLSVISSLLQIATDLCLKSWSDSNNEHALHYIAGYGLIGITDQLVAFVRGWLIICVLGFSSAFTIFKDMTQGLVHTSPIFFDKTPRGRIVSRFSKDIPNIEITLPRMIFQVTRHISSAVLSLSIIVYSSPVVIPFLVALSFAYWHYKLVYLVAHREFRRLSGITQAPLLSLLLESLEGAESIRAYGQSDRFLNICYADNDFERRVDYLNFIVSKWLALRIQFLTSTIIFITSIYLLWKGTSGGMVGFAMSYIFSMSASLKELIGTGTRFDGEFVTVERCFEYANLKAEGASNGIDADWKSGTVSFENYSAEYDLGRPILHNVSFSIKAGEKIGVVGRTGAGKSSLILALFRMLLSTEGNVSIDGSDIEKLDLVSLRRSLAIIPQDSLLFLGTVRENIDPFGDYLDEQIWEVLKDVNLHETVADLNSKVNESGSNFSAGQKQLICLARALLKDSKILVLDEATASVDTQTDKLVHDIIRKKATEKTIITIAHRTDTVLNSDKILALQDGRVVEYDEPQKLLERDSLFRRLIEANT